jgi:hypothetical protein
MTELHDYLKKLNDEWGKSLTLEALGIVYDESANLLKLTGKTPEELIAEPFVLLLIGQIIEMRTTLTRDLVIGFLVSVLIQEHRGSE